MLIFCLQPGWGGFASTPGACAPYDSRTQMSYRAGIVIDQGAYDAVRGAAHEIGHMSVVFFTAVHIFCTLFIHCLFSVTWSL